MKLKNLIERKGRLTEEVIEPSEQVIKGVQKELKLRTGINAVLGLDKKSPTALYYASDLSKEIRTPVLNSLFSSMTLDITAVPSGQIGGYTFSVSINYLLNNYFMYFSFVFWLNFAFKFKTILSFGFC